MFNKQSSGNDSIQLQNVVASRDVVTNSINNYNTGLTFSDVRDICTSLMEYNFPKLLEEANKTARSNLKKFFSELEKKMRNDMHNIVEEQMASVDTQFIMADITMKVARYGERINLNTIASLLLEKLKNTDDEKNILINEALETAIKLNKSEIEFLAIMVVYYNELVFTPISNEDDLIRAIEDFDKIISCNALNIKLHGLEWKKAIKIRSNISSGFQERLSQKYQNCNIRNLEENSIVKQICYIENKKELYKIELTDIGIIIGGIYLHEVDSESNVDVMELLHSY